MNFRKKIILLVLCFMFFDFDYVYAKDTYDISYDITSFNVSGNKMTLKGYSYISHVDNWGGKNLHTYIVAYTGTWGKKSGSKPAASDKNFGNCLGNGNGTNKTCMTFKTSVDGGHNDYVVGAEGNYYVARCTNSGGCSETNEKEHFKELTRGGKSAEKGTCYDGASGPDRFGGAHCLYYDTNFTAEIDLEKVFKELSSYKKIKFRIVSQTRTGVNIKKKEGGTVTTDSRNLGFDKSVCSSNISEQCKVGEVGNIGTNLTITVDDEIRTYKNIKIGGLSNTVKVTVNAAQPRLENYGNMADYYLDVPENVMYCSSHKKAYNQFALVSRSSSKKTYSKFNRNVAVYTYGILGKTDGTCRHNGKSGHIVGCAGENSPGGCETTYYIPVQWAEPSGSLYIENDFEKESDDTPTSKCTCVGDNCSDKSCVKKSFDVKSCSTSSKKNNECSEKDYEASCTETFSSSNKQYYIAVNAKDVLTAARENSKLQAAIKGKDIPDANGNKYIYLARSRNIRSYNANSTSYTDPTDVRITNAMYATVYYIPVVFNANVNFYQKNSKLFFKDDGSKNVNDNSKSKFELGQTIDSGRYFHFSLGYNAEAGYSIPKYEGACSENNCYNNVITNAEIGYKYNDELYYVKTKLYIDIKDTTEVYTLSGDDNKTPAKRTGLKVADIYKKIVDDEKPLDDISKDNLELDVTFPDSNVYYTDDSEDVSSMISPGQFVCNEVGKGSNYKKVTCNYDINKAYIKKTNGNIVYSKNGKGINNDYMITNNRGSIYFIPSDMKTDDIFTFNVNTGKNENLSMVPYFDFEYNASCSVKARNVIRNHPDDPNGLAGVVYRPIDVNDPFPSDKYGNGCNGLPKNWSDYCKNNGLNRIIKQSYNGVSYATKELKSDKIKEIKNIANNNTDWIYSKTGDMTSGGKSKFVNDSYFDLYRGNHCDSGTFKTTCDQVQ